MVSVSVGTVKLAVPPVPTLTVFTPSSPDATKSAYGASLTRSFTASAVVGAGVAVTVKAAAVPSVTEAASSAMETTVRAGSTTVTVTVPVAAP